jgi:D-alanine--poly(phosphoribitol) ligase subunit 1
VATTSVLVDRHLLSLYDPLPVGVPKPGSHIHIQDGEIVVAGPNVSPGYVNRPDLTSERFFAVGSSRAYRTGDAGHFQDGLLFFDGRLDDQIKLHGYRIELGDVEANLRALPGVCDACVVPVYRNSHVDALAAFVSEDAQRGETDYQTATRIRQALAERIPQYMIPRVVHRVERFPLTPNGKIDRRALGRSLSTP